jgi:hypothetical protein
VAAVERGLLDELEVLERGDILADVGAVGMVQPDAIASGLAVEFTNIDAFDFKPFGSVGVTVS